MTTGRLDTRFSGPDIDPLSQRAEYDPQSAALSSAYVSAFNEYARKELHYGEGRASSRASRSSGPGISSISLRVRPTRRPRRAKAPM